MAEPKPLPIPVGWNSTLGYIIPFSAPFLYIGAFATNSWVVTDKLKWGLWNLVNSTNGTGESASQQSISIHDSEGYFIACQAVACVTLVLFILIFFSLCAEQLRMPKTHIVIVFTAVSGSVTTLATLGSHYKDDDRWKDLDPSLGVCYWLTLAAAICICILGIVSVYYAQKDEWKPLPKVSPQQQRSWRRGSNASQISISKSKKIIIFRSEEYNASNMVLPQTVNRPADQNVQEASSGEFPILDLPSYDLATEPGSRMQDDIAPPNYEEVARGAKSPPPPAVFI